MKNPTVLALEKLNKRELVYKDSKVGSGFIEIEYARRIIEELEVDLLNSFDSACCEKCKRKNYD